MAALATQQIKTAGLSPAYTAASGGGDTCIPGESTFLHVKNGDAASHTVTVVTPIMSHGLAVADLAVAVPAGRERMIGPIDPGTFKQDDGTASITYDAVTSVTVAVITL